MEKFQQPRLEAGGLFRCGGLKSKKEFRRCKDLIPDSLARTAVAVGIFLRGRGVVAGVSATKILSSVLERNCHHTVRRPTQGSYIITTAVVAVDLMMERR